MAEINYFEKAEASKTSTGGVTLAILAVAQELRKLREQVKQVTEINRLIGGGK